MSTRTPTTRLAIGLAVVFAAASLPRAHAAALKQPDPLRTIDNEIHGSANQQSQAITQINALFTRDPRQAAFALARAWGLSLLHAHHEQLVLDLALKGILAAPDQTLTVQNLLQFRVIALLRLGQPDEALREAKDFFNLANPAEVSTALRLVADALAQAHPDDPGIYERFVTEQIAGRAESLQPVVSPLMNSIDITVNNPFAAKLAELLAKHPDDEPGLAALGNLQLLNGKPNEATVSIEEAESASDRQAPFDVEGAQGRAIKAHDGTIGRSNAWFRSSELLKLKGPTDMRGLAALPWKQTMDAPASVRIPLAVLPPLRTADQAAHVNIPLAVLPWQLEKQTLPLARVPFALIKGIDGKPLLIDIPAGVDLRTLRDPSHLTPVAIARADYTFETPDVLHRHKPAPLTPMAVATDDNPPPQPATQPTAKDTAHDDQKFIVSLCRDLSGRVWVGTEDQGVWCYDATQPKAKQWVQYTTQNGLGDDDAYAIACDKLGRIWVGHLNHGVSVFNGDHFRNYGVLDGPIGERVFSIAVCPTDGDVWIATSAGITRYSQKKDDWSYYTRAEGLPSDQASSIAFDQDGNIVVGTQCDGIAMADAKDDYKTWRTVHAQQAYQERPPLVPAGDGLPTDLINQVLVAHDGTIYAATTTGLAWSSDKGKTWQFSRGADWAAKVRGLYGGPPKDWDEKDQIAKCGEPEWQEDYLTCLAEDDNGLLWIGTREHGYEVLEPKSGLVQLGTTADAAHAQAYIYAILPTPAGPSLVGQYEGGLVESKSYFKARGNALGSSRAIVAPGETAFPTPMRPPTQTELDRLQARLAKLESDAAKQPQSPVITLASDWTTQGAWLGRYGRYWICLCACISPSDFIWGTGAANVNYTAAIGPHHDKGDSLRYWVHWNHTANPKSLELPMPYLDSRVQKHLTTWAVDRRQSEWDDHGEAYPETMQGPDIYCSVTIPKGAFFLSLYDMNKDGHGGPNRFRDYQISIREKPAGHALSDFSGFEQQPELARARCRDFWGGVYFRFILSGPRIIDIRISRNYSFNSLIAAIALDPTTLELLPYPRPNDFGYDSKDKTVGLEFGWDEDGPYADLAPRPVSLIREFDIRTLKLILGRPNDATQCARSLYECSQFSLLENSTYFNNSLTPRVVEESLRWSGESDTYLNEDYVLVAHFAQDRILHIFRQGEK